MKHLRIFETKAEYDEMKATLETPCIALTEDNDKVYYMEHVIKPNSIIATYNIPLDQVNEKVVIMGNLFFETDYKEISPLSNVKKFRVDGGEWLEPTPTTIDFYGDKLVFPVQSYTFTEEGKHTIEVILNDETKLGVYYNGNDNVGSMFASQKHNNYGSYYLKIAGITNIELPNSITSIGQAAFHNCSLTSVSIPNWITSIGQAAFWACPSLTSVSIPNSITSIPRTAFWACSSLTSVSIPNSITSIDKQAFSDCTRLTSITYSGTKSQWNAIAKDNSWHNYVPSTCLVHCTDGNISI